MKNIGIAILASFVLIITSCRKEFFSDCLDGNDAIETVLIDLDEVTNLSVSFSAVTTIDEGETQKIELTGPKVIIDKIVADSKYSSSNKEYDMKLIGCSTFKDVTLNVVLVKLEGISVSGSSDITFLNPFMNIDNVEFESSGESEMDIKLGIASNVDIDISGTSDIIISGAADIFRTDISGSGNLDALEFAVKNCEIDISGSANAKVNVEDQLIVDISGSADVCYKGSPTISLDLSGSGSVEECE